MNRFFFVLFAVFVCAGCAAPRVYVYSVADPEISQYSFDKKITILNQINDLEEKRLSLIIKEELSLFGFWVIEEKDQADLGLIFDRDTVTSSQIRSERVPVTRTTTGYYGDKKIEFISRDEKIMTYSYDYTLNKLWLDIYLLDKGRKAELPLWQAYGGMDLDLFKKYERETIRTMLGFYGRNFDDWVQINAGK